METEDNTKSAGTSKSKGRSLAAGIFSGISFLATALLPFGLWYFLRDERFIEASVCLLMVLGIRALAALMRGRAGRELLWTTLLGMVLCGICLWFRSASGGRLLLLYPVLVSLSLLLLFGQSLWTSKSMVERFAELHVPVSARTEAFKRYCRHVTQVWCVFFLFNGSMALGLALWASPEIWALYTGVISYMLIGLMFAGEYLVRRMVQRLHWSKYRK